MSVVVKYFLNIEKIMGIKTEKFDFGTAKTLRALLEENISADKIEQLNKITIIITKNGESCKDLDVVAQNGDVFCLFPAIYGG